MWIYILILNREMGLLHSAADTEMRNMQSLPYSDVVFKASIVRLYVYSPLKEQSNPFQFYGMNFFLFLTCFWLLHNQDFQDGVQKVKGEEKITCRLKHYAFCCMQCLFLSTLFSFNGLSAFANLPRIARLSATFLHSSHKLLTIHTMKPNNLGEFTTALLAISMQQKRIFFRNLVVGNHH